MMAEDLVGTIFPDQVACAENLVGEREVPDHPLVAQTISDCLNEAMDIEGLERLLAEIESGAIRIVARDLTEPSPLAREVLTARPYAYLDDAPLEERRTQAVMSRRWLDPDSADEIGRLDAAAMTRVREEAWPDAANADELHDALVWLGFADRGGGRCARELEGLAPCAGAVAPCRATHGARRRVLGAGRAATPVRGGLSRCCRRAPHRPSGERGPGLGARCRPGRSSCAGGSKVKVR